MQSKPTWHRVLRRLSLRSLASLIILLAAAEAAQAEPKEPLPPQIARIDRNVNVQNISIGIEFAQPMIPLGGGNDPQFSPPIRIEPELGCVWGWYGQSRLECEYSRETPPPPATRFVAHVGEGMYTREGEPLAPFRFSFETARPKVQSVDVIDWLSPVQPEIRVQTNMPVTASSLAAHLYLAGTEGRVAGLAVRASAGSSAGAADVTDNWIAVADQPLAPDAIYRIRVEAGLEIPDGELRGRAQEKLGWFKTWGPFRFLNAVCDGLHLADEDALDVFSLRPEEIVNSQPCDPRRPVPLVFSAPLAADSLRMLTAGSPLEKERTALNQQTSIHALATVLLKGIPAGRSFEIELMEGLRDRFGRPLRGSRQLRFATADFPPYAHPVQATSVIAQGSDTDLVLQAINAERYFLDAGIETVAGKTSFSGWRNVDTPQANALTFVPVQIEALLGGKSGRVVGWAGLRKRDSMRLAGRNDLAHLAGFPRERYELAADGLLFESIVTSLNIVVANTHERTVWVTDIRTGAPVPGAAVSFDLDTSQDDARDLAGGCLSISRMTDAEGVARFPPFGCNWTLVRVEQGDAIATLPLEPTFASSSNDYEHHDQELYENGLIVWGFTDKGLYRPGETVRYQLYVRQRVDNHLELPDELTGYSAVEVGYPGALTFDDPDIALTEFATHSGSVRLPENVKDGGHRISLAQRGYAISGGVDFLVATFEPQPYSVKAGVDDEIALADTSVPVHATAEFTAGGPYADADAQILAVIEPGWFGVDSEALTYFNFMGDRGLWWPQENARRTTTGLRFDENGRLIAKAALPATEIGYGTLSLSVGARHAKGAWVYSPELELPYSNRPYYVGIRSPVWRARGAASIDVAVVSALRVPKAGLDVELQLARASQPARAADPAEDDARYQKIQTCKLVSSGEIDTCPFAPVDAGEYWLTARLFEDERLVHEAMHAFTVAEPAPDLTTEPTRLELETSLTAERDVYTVGDMAKLTLRNPFGRAQALVLVRRNRLLSQWIQLLERPVETVQFELGENYAPGVTVQVVVVPADLDRWMRKNSTVDIPTWSADVHTDIEVRRRSRPFSVRIDSATREFRPGDTVQLELAASESGVHEFAVAVVDDALLRLIEDEGSYFDPDRWQRLVERWERPESWILSRALLAPRRSPPTLPGDQGRVQRIMLTPQSDDDSGLISVTGSRIASFEFSDLPDREVFPAELVTGAQRGSANDFDRLAADIRLRSLFAENAHWEPAIPSNSAGRAKLRFALPDNLTRWRAVVVATSADGRVAMGSLELPVRLPVEVRVELPSQLARGDRFTARANATNRGTTPRDLTLKVAAGEASQKPGRALATTRSVTAAPFRPESLGLPVTADREGHVDVLAVARARDTGDALVRGVPVRGTVERRTLPLIGTLTGGHVRVPIESPGDAANMGASLDIGLSASAIADLSDAFGFMRDYPHVCWEQNLSRAVAAANLARLSPFVAPDTRYPPRFVQDLLHTVGQFETRSGGITFFEPADEYVSDYLTAYTAQAFDWLHDLGYAVPEEVQTQLHDYLWRRLNEDLWKRASKTETDWWPLSADVRASMLAGLAGKVSISPDLIESLLEDRNELSLFGRSELLMALEGDPAFAELRQPVVEELRAHTKESATKIEITGEDDRGDATLLSSDARTHCAMILALDRLDEPAVDTGWLAKLVRTAQQIGDRRAGFGDTHSTAICLQALAEFHERHKSVQPATRVEIRLDRKRRGALTPGQTGSPRVGLETPLDLAKPRHALELRAGTDEPIFYSLRLHYDVDQATRPAQNAGFTIARSYAVYRNDEWLPVDELASPRIGDWVRISLKIVNPVLRHLVAVSDPVAGGLRPTDPNLSTVAPAGLLEAAKGSAYFYARQLKPDTSRFYAELLPPGTHEVVYFAQATTEGRFIALPARVEDMYAQDIYGTSNPVTIEIGAQQ